MQRLATMITLTAMLLAAACAAPQPAEAQDNKGGSGGLICPLLPTLMDQYLDSHTVFEEQDSTLNKRIVQAYIERFDPNETLLTQSEFKQLEKRVKTMVTDIREGECEDFDWLKEQQVAWHTDMESFVKGMLDDDSLEIDKTVEFQVDPDQRDRPANKKEQKELRRKLVHLQLANYINAGVTMEEAREKLAARYERTRKRIEELDEVDVYSDYLDAYARALDPHSSYLSADDLEDFRISMELSLEGIGALLRSEDGFVVVQELVPGGAADRQGKLRPKDKIIAVAQGQKGEPTQVIDMALRDVIKMIRGKKGTDVKLTILRKGAKTETLDIVITRDKIDLEEQAAKLTWVDREVDGETLKLALIELPSFYGGRTNPDAAVKDVKRLLEEANEGKADGVLLDLSRNGGGLLTAAVDITGLFINEGPVVGVVGRTAGTDILEDKDEGIVYSGPLVVLTSRISASASEILAGALQDYERAVIVGDDHTFGKGTVQQLSPLPPGLGAIKVTTAMFYLPEGESTQSEGVSADVVVPSMFNLPEISEKSQPNALPAGKIERFETDTANPDKAYSPVTRKTLKKLVTRSKKRVDASEEFKELAKDLAERSEEKTLKLSELLEEGDSGEDTEDADEESEEDDDEISVQAKEALNVLADLASMQK